MLVYEKNTGVIIARIPRGQPYDYLYDGKDLEIYEIDFNIDFERYLIIDNQLIELNGLEISEMKEHGKILSEDERMENDLLNSLKPSWQEIKKAEKTIEILSILSEVL